MNLLESTEEGCCTPLKRFSSLSRMPSGEGPANYAYLLGVTKTICVLSAGDIEVKIKKTTQFA